MSDRLLRESTGDAAPATSMMIDPTPTLRTERLVLRPMSAGDPNELVAYFTRNRAHLERWEPARNPEFYTVEFQRRAIERSIADANGDTMFRFLVFEREGSTMVASINLNTIRRGVIFSAIPGYSVDAAYEGRGYASEIVAAVVRFAFEDLGLHRLETSYQPQNHASARVLEKNGFVVEGYARDYLFFGGAWRDGVLVSRTNHAWRDPSLKA